MTTLAQHIEQTRLAPMMAGSSLPVIDFGEYGLEHDSSLVSDSDLESLAAQLIATLQRDGFVYLTNHGIADELVGILHWLRIPVSGLVHSNITSGHSHQLHNTYAIIKIKVRIDNCTI